jgi:hypothetical protein
MATSTVKLELLIEARDDATAQIKKVTQTLEKEAKKVESSLDSMAGAFDFGDRIFDASKRALTGLLGIANSASDVTEAINFVDQVFGDASQSIQQWADTANRSALLSKKGALDAAASIGIFGRRIELTGGALANFSTDLVQLAADMASLKNTRVEDAVVAIAAAMRNEYEPIRRYGVVLNDVVLKAEALRLGIYDGSGQLTQQQKIIAVNSELYKQMDVAIGDVARTFDNLANQQRFLQANLENTSATLGETLAPTFARVVGAANSALLIFQEMPPFLQSAATNSLLLASAFGLLFGGGVKLVGMFSGLRESFAGMRASLEAMSTSASRSQRAFAGLAKGGVALTAAFAISTVLIDAANAMERIGERTEDAFGKMAAGAQKFDSALTLEGLQALLETEDDTARLSNLWEDLGDEVQISMSGAKIDIEEFDNAMGKLKDTSATLAYQVLDDLEASIGTTFGPQGVENANRIRESIEKWRKEIDESVETQARLSAAREEDEKLMADQARALGLVEGETEELTEEQQKQIDVLEKLGDNLATLDRDYELAGGAMEAFESATERFNDTLYAQDEAQIEVFDSFAALGDQIKENGKSLEVTTKEGRDNKKAVIDLGKAIREDLVQAYKDSDGSLQAVTDRAGYWNDVLKLQQRELGLTDDEMREYQKTLGLTPAQVQTLVKLNGQEEARIQIELLNLDLEEIDNKVVVAKIQQQILTGDYIGARDTIQQYYDRNPVTLRIRAEGLGQMNAWLQGGVRPTRAAAPSGGDGSGLSRAAPFSNPGVPMPGSTINVGVPNRRSVGGTTVIMNMPPGVDEWKVMSAIERYQRRNGPR